MIVYPGQSLRHYGYARLTKVADLSEGDLVVHEQAAWEIAYLNTYRDDPEKRSMRLRDPRDFNRVVKGVVTGGMFVLEPHYPVCGACAGLWPCLEHRRDREGKDIMLELEHSCASCGGQVTGKNASFTTPEGIRRRYHWAKKYGRCRQAALAEAQRCGLELVDDGWGARPARLKPPASAPNPAPPHAGLTEAIEALGNAKDET